MTLNTDDAVNNVTTPEQRRIDEQISQFHARIRSLNTERNTYARISRLPAEIMAEVFLHIKRAADHALAHDIRLHGVFPERAWLVVAGVCTHWREIALDCPLLWSRIKLTPVDRALTMIGRTKLAPLFISCPHLGGKDPGLDRIVPVVMSNIHRVKELDLRGGEPDRLFEFLRLNGGASAPILQVLTLRIPLTTLPKDILERPMESLQELRILDGSLNSPFPPFPQLTRLIIDPVTLPSSALAIDVLIECLRNAPKIEELRVKNVISPLGETSGDSKSSVVHLPHLTSLEIDGSTIGSSKLLSLLSHPQTSNIDYRCRTPVGHGSDMSDLQNALIQFSSLPDRVIRDVLVKNDSTCSIVLDTVLHSSSHSFTLTLDDVFKDDLARLLSAVPFSKTTSLYLLDPNDTLQPSHILRLCDHVEVLKLEKCTVSVFHGLMKAKNSKLPLPRLRVLVLYECEFYLTYEEPDTLMCNAMASLLKQRRRLKSEFQELTIRACEIREKTVDRFRKYVNVSWDWYEIERHDEDDSEEDDSLDDWPFF